jgi:hypothetical protein
MTRFLAVTLALAGALAGLAIPTAAGAHRLARPYNWDGPEANGCYFSRGEMFCGRYCYIEINGKRYCQLRERDAYPQGEVYIEDSIVPLRRSRHHRHIIK